MTASSVWPEPRPWDGETTLAELRLRLELAGSVPEPRPEGLAALGMALEALGVATPAEASDAAAATESASAPLPEPAPVDASENGRLIAYRNAVLAAAEAEESRRLAEAALLVEGGEGNPRLSADILARMDAIAMDGASEDNGGAEFAALRNAYHAALKAEAEVGIPPAGTAGGALLASAEAARADSRVARAALERAEAAILGGREMSPDVLAELHRLLGIEAEIEELRTSDAPFSEVASDAGSAAFIQGASSR